MSFVKKYGLIVPEKGKSQQPVFQAARNVFGDDSDSESESSKKPALLRPSDNINRQAKITQEKAVMEDPTVYQYDEIYDSMTSKKEEKMVKSKEEKKPRYIENLMKTANKRKIENERRMERQIQKEREKEGDMFADKEVFVTSAYKKKLEEIKLEEEKEKREEYLESIGDVTKQSDLGGFYRHLYEQKLGSDKNSDQQKQTQDPPQHNLSKESSESESEKDKETSTISKKRLLERNYRKRKSSQDNNKHLSEGEIEDSEEEINRVNLTDIKNAKRSKCNENIDADSDFSIDDSSDNNDEDCKIEQKSNNSKFSTDKVSATAAKNELMEINAENNLKSSTTAEKDDEKETKIKIDIWKKRTVGTVFEEALKRYYERKAARGM